MTVRTSQYATLSAACPFIYARLYIQESQPQRYLDNQYMFSVRASSRRWYELMAAKIFGVVKNKGDYCEVLYSWYVRHHHTLNRQMKHKRIVQQMNEIIRDHLDSGFIDRVEYRRIREVGKEIDFFIRFFPGLAAKHSIARVASSLNKKRKPPAGEPRVFSRRRSRRGLPTDGALNEIPTSEVQANQPEIIQPTTAAIAATSNILFEDQIEFANELAERGIARSQAVKLLSTLPADRRGRVGEYIEYWDLLRKQKQVTEGLLFNLIRNGDPLPASFETSQQRAAKRAAEVQKGKLTRLEEALTARYEQYRRQTIDGAIAEVPLEEFEQRVSEHKKQTTAAGGFVGERPEMAEQFARIAIRAEIGKTAQVESYEDFRRRTLRAAISDLQLDPEALGIDLSENETKIDSAPNALYAPQSNDQAQSLGSSISEQNTSPEAV